MLSRISLRLSDVTLFVFRSRAERNGDVAKALERGAGPTPTGRAAGTMSFSHLDAPSGAGGQVLKVPLIATP